MIEIFDDIRKLYRFSLPCPELAGQVEFFSESSAEATHRFAAGNAFEIKMFPSWTPTFWINLGEAYDLQIGKKNYRIKKQQDILLIRDAATTRCNAPLDYIFTVKFYPGALEAIFGVSQPQFINTFTNLGHILPASLIDAVRKEIHFEKRMELLQKYFLLKYEQQKKKDHYVQLVRESIALYKDDGLHYNTNQVSEKMFIHSKTINRYFNRVVGTGPKKYFSMLRTRTALAAWLENKKTFDPTTYGYHDNSHFYKSVRDFTK